MRHHVADAVVRLGLGLRLRWQLQSTRCLAFVVEVTYDSSSNQSTIARFVSVAR